MLNQASGSSEIAAANDILDNVSKTPIQKNTTAESQTFNPAANHRSRDSGINRYKAF